ncbi:MAG: TetR family transcriptional regulator C-terminal domain-containing protein, partial [Pseudomonadota bacterium]
MFWDQADEDTLETEIKAKRPRTASKEVRRRQLIEATIASIAQHGLIGTTMATVTGIANLSMGIVSFHFQSKENLLRETLLFLAAEHRENWIKRSSKAGLRPQDKLIAVISAHFDPAICTQDRIAVWFAFFGEAHYRKTYDAKLAPFDHERGAVMEDLCQTIIDEGGYQGVDAKLIAHGLESFADGLWLNIMMCPGDMTPEIAEHQI